MSILLDVMAKTLDGGRGGVRTPQAGAGILLFPFVLEFNGLTVTNRALGLHFYIMHFLCALLPPAKVGQPFDLSPGLFMAKVSLRYLMCCQLLVCDGLSSQRNARLFSVNK